MGLEQNNEQHYREVVDKYADPSNANLTMTTRDYVVRAIASSGTVTITLPPVAEAVGRFYSIIARTASRTYPITIQDNDDSEGWIDMSLYADGDKAIFYSDGMAWINLSGGAVGSVRTTIDSDAVKALTTTQAVLVPAPGSGRVLEFLSATLKLEYGGSNVFTEAGDNLTINYTDDSGVVVSEVIECTGFIDQSAHTLTCAIPVKDAIVAYTSAANQALVLDNNNADFAGNAAGDNNLIVDTLFRVVDFN